jgi:Mg2+ and Co2+ transporter CorA
MEELIETEFSRRFNSKQADKLIQNLKAAFQHFTQLRLNLGDFAISDMIDSRSQKVDAFKESLHKCKQIQQEAKQAMEYKLVSEVDEEEIEHTKEEIEELVEMEKTFKEYDDLVASYGDRIHDFKQREAALNPKASVEEGIKDLANDVITFKDEIEESLKEIHTT